MQQSTTTGARPTPLLWVAACALAAVGYAFEARQEGDGTQSGPEAPVSFAMGGGNADSNNTMIAVTGMDLTGQSILYLVDTVNYQLSVYQASGGSASTQGVKFVGARNIGLDFQLDGFNDKSEHTYKELKREFERLEASSEND